MSPQEYQQYLAWRALQEQRRQQELARANYGRGSNIPNDGAHVYSGNPFAQGIAFGRRGMFR